MNLIALGINHNSAAVEVRERVAFAPEQVGEALGDGQREFFPGVSYRHLYVRRNGEVAMRTTPPSGAGSTP